MKEHFREHAQRPFFLYVAYTSAHWPMHAPEEQIERYRGRYDAGFDAIREERLQRGRALGVLEDHWPLSQPRADWAASPHQAWERRCMEVYAAMVDRMDQGIGWLVAELERQELLENTVFLYLQDNGGCAEGYGRKSNADRASELVTVRTSASESQA